MMLTQGKLSQLLSLVALLAAIGSRPGLSLDGRSVPRDSPLQRTVVGVRECTGLAMKIDVVLTNAHCVLEDSSLQDVDNGRWRERPLALPSELYVTYYLGGRQISRGISAVAALKQGGRDLALLKVQGGHPAGAIPVDPPLGRRYAERLNLDQRPTLLILARGSHSDGSLSQDDLRWVEGQAQKNGLVTGGYFISVASRGGACRGDSGSPVFLAERSGLAADPRKLTVVGVLSGFWISSEYGIVDYSDRYGIPHRHCGHDLIASSLFTGLDEVDANRWLAITLRDWNSLPASAEAPSSTIAASSKDAMITRFLKRSEELTAPVFNSPKAQTP